MMVKRTVVDFNAMTLTIRQGKAKRVDVLPLHQTLATLLGKQLEQTPAIGSAKVFRTAVTDATRRRDFERAGIPQVLPKPDSTTSKGLHVQQVLDVDDTIALGVTHA